MPCIHFGKVEAAYRHHRTCKLQFYMVYVPDDCNCVFDQIFLHVIIFEFSLVNYTENATELFMHEQTVDVLPDYF